jgi:hypothetical protein
MTPVITNDTSRAGYKALRVGGKYPRLAPAADEQDSTPLSVQEFEQDCRDALTPSQFMSEVEQRIRKW